MTPECRKPTLGAEDLLSATADAEWGREKIND